MHAEGGEGLSWLLSGHPEAFLEPGHVRTRSHIVSVHRKSSTTQSRGLEKLEIMVIGSSMARPTDTRWYGHVRCRHDLYDAVFVDPIAGMLTDFHVHPHAQGGSM